MEAGGGRRGEGRVGGRRGRKGEGGSSTGHVIIIQLPLGTRAGCNHKFQQLN